MFGGSTDPWIIDLRSRESGNIFFKAAYNCVKMSHLNVHEVVLVFYSSDIIGDESKAKSSFFSDMNWKEIPNES